mmetsp:Transcript_116064/g.248215  ORF Transcript_116064/g.248215 Transcript_116064/m.248215 type:complete len:263 (+) Transcript_116064:31-819(+)
MVRWCSVRHRSRNRRVASGVALLASVASACAVAIFGIAQVTVGCGVPFLVAGKVANSAGRKANAPSGPSRRVLRHAEAPKVEEEPDLSGEVARMFKDSIGLNLERPITAEDRVTPIDRWFGWDRSILDSRDDDDPFVDSSDDMNYVTILLEKPLGIEFVENTMDEGGGVMVSEVQPSFSAHMSGMVRPGYHLIVADDVPVYGLPFEEALKPLVDKEDGPVKLTFFIGDAIYFYGEFRPSSAWLSEYLAELKTREADDPLAAQ